MSSTSAQVHVCQMPRSLWRMAGRAPKIWALRTSNLGNVSAPAAAFGATALSSREAAHFGATLYPSPSCSDDLCLDMKTPPEGGQVSDLGIAGMAVIAPYSAALRKEADPERNCSRNAASSAFAAARCRCLTGP